MKKIIITLSLLVTVLFAGNAQTSTADSDHKGKNHHGHNSYSKKDRHHKGIRLFHGHHHRGKDHARSESHSHHGKDRHTDTGSNENK